MLAANYRMEPRASTETDRRYLLADSVAPSESASMIDYGEGDGDRTPRAHSLAPTSNEAEVNAAQPEPAGKPKIPAGAAFERRDTIAAPSQRPQPYKGFPSEAHYLAALHAWAESKRYLEADNHLIGFYGEKTIADYASAPAPEGLGLRKKWQARKEARRESKAKIAAAGSSDRPVAGSRRNTVT